MNKKRMNKEDALRYLKNNLQLRTPQFVSLRLFADYLESESGQALIAKFKKTDRQSISVLEKRAVSYFQNTQEGKLFNGFDGRNYPTFTYALATGVGKTRLMGAFIAYLYLVYEVKHFLLVAPGNTIYRKLVEDFTLVSKPKYVFRGLEEFNSGSIRVITKDDVPKSAGSDLMAKIEINIFNVQQFAQKDIAQEKGITKFSEVLGESYFDYLSNLDDLVVLLDESHHYHADAAFASLDRLEPLMGLELTATPYTGQLVGRGQNRTAEMKQSIVYLYNLGDAIRDGYVKDPWIGTEADLDYKQIPIDSMESDLRKLHLAVYFHERAKYEIQKYAFENHVEPIKPVMLVVATDTAHASQLKSKIESPTFHGGIYKSKVLEVHTGLKGEESEAAIQQLISLEDKYNYIEIVIHVNMLKEGWDVSNIYTIVPLRSSAGDILTEQTIGRGLRLPYGEKTGAELVDRVVIVAHEKYSQVVEKARTSELIQPTNIEKISENDLRRNQKILQSKPVQLTVVEDEVRNSSALFDEITAIAEKEIEKALPLDAPQDLFQHALTQRRDELIENVAKQEIFSTPDNDSVIDSFTGKYKFPFTLQQDSINSLKQIRRKILATSEQNYIPIPRLILSPSFSRIEFEDFSLDTSELAKYKADINVLEQRLQSVQYSGDVEDQSKVAFSTISSYGSIYNQPPENTLMAALVGRDLVDYDSQKILLLKLVKQAIEFYSSFYPDHNILIYVIESHAHEISDVIYRQMLGHKTIIGEGFDEVAIGSPRPLLDQYNITMEEDEAVHSLDSELNTFSAKLVYSYFKKACHQHYKFDSSDEARFAYLLDRDRLVQDWLRPAPNQFEGLYWRDQQGGISRKYEPDFVVELDNEIVMVEVKPQSKINDSDVLAKSQAAIKYCDVVNQNIGNYGIKKPWRYIIIPTDKITIQSTVASLLAAIDKKY